MSEKRLCSMVVIYKTTQCFLASQNLQQFRVRSHSGLADFALFAEVQFNFVDFASSQRIGTHEPRIAARSKNSLPAIIRQCPFRISLAAPGADQAEGIEAPAHVIPAENRDALDWYTAEKLRKCFYFMWRRVAIVTFESRMHEYSKFMTAWMARFDNPNPFHDGQV